jgi:hypothetical protein
MSVETETKLKPVRVDLEPAIHDVLRIEAAKARMSMASFARQALTKLLMERSKKGS